MKKIAIIGSNGQLGQDLVRHLRRNHEVLPFTRNDVDITSRQSVEKIFALYDFDILITTAAFHKTDECEINPEMSFLVNSIGTKYLSENAKKYDKKLFYISTDYVFDGLTQEPYTETSMPNPINIYGISKLAGEKIVRNYLGDNGYIIRVSSLFGKAVSTNKQTNFVYTMLKLAQTNPELKVISDIRMSPTYTVDAASYIEKIISKGMVGGIFHGSNQGDCSWYEFAKTIFEIIDYDVAVLPFSHKEFLTVARSPLNSSLSTKYSELASPHWKDGLKRFLQEIQIE